MGNLVQMLTERLRLFVKSPEVSADTLTLFNHLRKCPNRVSGSLKYKKFIHEDSNKVTAKEILCTVAFGMDFSIRIEYNIPLYGTTEMVDLCNKGAWWVIAHHLDVCYSKPLVFRQYTSPNNVLSYIAEYQPSKFIVIQPL